MKKLFFGLCVLFSINSFAQDSTQITIQWQARDIEYSGRYICDQQQFETLFDSLKIKFRVVTPPTGTNTVSLTAYTIDMMNLYSLLNIDAVAVNNNVTSRLKALLLAVGQTYLTNYINSVDTANQEAQSNARNYGRFRLRKKN
jgi:hypothetical protein